MEELVFSAPGKVILHGEHAVVYGKSALAAALNLRTFVRLLVQSEADPGDARPITGRQRTFRVHFTDLGIRKTWNIEDLESLLPGYKEDRSQSTRGSGKKKRAENFDAGVNTPNDPSSKTLAALRRLAAKEDHPIQNGDSPQHGLSTNGYEDNDRPSDIDGPEVANDVNGHHSPSSSSLSSSSLAAETAALPLLHLYLGICGTHAQHGKGGWLRLPSTEVVVASNIPVGAGLGSSAAFCVALAAAFLKHCGVGDKKVVNQWAFSGEKLIHGTPSGIDNAVATYGRVLLYRDGRITAQESAPNLDILLVDTRVPRSTKDLVAGVKSRQSQTPLIINPILDSIDRITQAANVLLVDLNKTAEIQGRANIYEQLGNLMGTNHHLLNALGVGHEALEVVRGVASSKGLHAKLTGGGGGGCAICLIDEGASDEEVKAVIEMLEEKSFSCTRTLVGGEGLVNHNDVIDENVAFMKVILKSAYAIPDKLFSPESLDIPA